MWMGNCRLDNFRTMICLAGIKYSAISTFRVVVALTAMSANYRRCNIVCITAAYGARIFRPERRCCWVKSVYPNCC